MRQHRDYSCLIANLLYLIIVYSIIIVCFGGKFEELCIFAHLVLEQANTILPFGFCLVLKVNRNPHGDDN